MSTWFECVIKYDKVQENGMEKKVSESYLVDAISFTEAEARIIEEMKGFISGDFLVSGIKRSNISELFYNEVGDKWFKCKVNFITLDEKSGSEKRTASYMLVYASTVDEADKNLKEGMKGTLADYEIESIKETKIMDVYPYNSKEEDK